MSRFTAGLGSAIGVLGGAVLGSFAGRAFPGRMHKDDSEFAGIALGALFGAAVGGVVGAGPDPQPKQVGVGTPPPRFP